MLDSDSSSSIDYNEVYSLFTKNDLEDVLINTNKQPMTVKEECEVIEKLRSENFDLKIRFYLLNQDYKELLNSMGSKQSSENGSIKNLNKKESTIKDKEIKVLRAVLEQRVRQLASLKDYYDDILRRKESELDELKMEKTSAYVTELECNAAALYEIIEQKDRESIELKDKIDNQKNEIKKLKDELIDKTISINELNLRTNTIETTTNDQLELNYQQNTFKLSLEETRKELDKIKFELKNQKIIEKEKLDNYSRLLTEKEVENELLKEQILTLKDNLKEREIYLEKENEQLKEIEENLINEINRLKEKEQLLIKENKDYELKFKEDYLIKKKQQIILNDNHQLESTNGLIKTTKHKSTNNNLDENDNLIKNSINLQELIIYTKNIEEKLDFQNELIRKLEFENRNLIANVNYLKERKINYEKIITQQLAKTDDLLKTAKMNLINK